jgi:hypothetical protein
MKYTIFQIILILILQAGCSKNTSCSVEGEYRCNGSVIEGCANKKWVKITDCNELGQICEEKETYGMTVANCTNAINKSDDDENANGDKSCTKYGEYRCSGDIIESCINNVWVEIMDCDKDDKICVETDSAMTGVTCEEKNQIQDNDETTDTDIEYSDELNSSDNDNEAPDNEFDPENPGYNIELNFIEMNLESKNNMVIGFVMKTAREDISSGKTEFPDNLDTCKIVKDTIYTPECGSDEDCALEQKCLPMEDYSGNPIANSERCVTPDRESMDVGPIKVSGFSSGTETFLFEKDDTVYKLNGEGDGSIEEDMIAYNSEYVVSANDPTPADLGSFSGRFNMGNELKLTSHTVTDGKININTTQPLKFSWTPGGKGGYIRINVFTADAEVECFVKDNGEFTIPDEFSSKLKYGNFYYENMLSMSRSYESKISGENVTVGTISHEQMIIYFIVVD